MTDGRGGSPHGHIAIQPGAARGRAVGPDHDRAVHVLADVPQHRLGRLRVRGPGEHRCPVPARLRPRLPLLGEHRHERVPGLRLQLDPRRRHHRDRAGGRPAAHHPAADRLRPVRPDLPELGQQHRPLRSRVIPHQRNAQELDRPDRRPCPADPGHPAAVRPARRPHASHGERRHRGEPELPAERLPGPDLQPVGGGVRRLVLRPLGPAAVLPGHHAPTPPASTSRPG